MTTEVSDPNVDVDLDSMFEEEARPTIIIPESVKARLPYEAPLITFMWEYEPTEANGEENVTLCSHSFEFEQYYADNEGTCKYFDVVISGDQYRDLVNQFAKFGYQNLKSYELFGATSKIHVDDADLLVHSCSTLPHRPGFLKVKFMLAFYF